MRALGAVFAVLFAACGHGSPERVAPRGAVVAEVDGVAIHVPELEARMRHDHVTSQVALQRLVDEALTVEAARRLGLKEQGDLAVAHRRALVQVMLAREIEDPIRPEDLTEEDLSRGWEQGRTLEADHLLAKTGSKATPQGRAHARALAARVGVAAKATTTREEFIALAASMREPGVELAHEDLGKFMRDGQYVAAFEEQAFRMTRAGEVSAPFETEFGWHVVRLRSVTNVFGESFEAAREEIASKIVTLRRRVALEALLHRLEKKAHVAIDEAALQALGPRP